MKKFSELRETATESLRTKILNRGKRPDARKVAEEGVEVVETEATSVIDILRQLHEDVAGRIVIVQEGEDNKEVYVDFETANYLLEVFEGLDSDAQSTFETTLIENIDNLDEIAMYCETVLENQKD